MSPKKMIGLSFAAPAAKLYEVFGQAVRRRTEIPSGAVRLWNLKAREILLREGHLLHLKRFPA